MNTSPMLNTAIKAVRHAAAVINRASFEISLLEINQQKNNDFISKIYKVIKNIIVKIIKSAYPNHAILNEEFNSLHNQNSKNENVWIIDPLNGSTNFIHGFPQYCISIALQQHGQITQAVVYDPTRNDLFIASKGHGAYLNEKRIRVSKQDKISDALISTSFFFRNIKNLNKYLEIFCIMTKNQTNVRSPGATTLDLAYVAAGRLDCFFEKDLKPWNIAAGSLLVSEAGGMIGTFKGEANYLYQGDILAGNPKIFSQQINMLSKFS